MFEFLANLFNLSFRFLKMLKTLRSNIRIPKNEFHQSLHRFQNRFLQKFEQPEWDEKIKFWLRKYQDVFGITKLTEVHERVLEAQKSIQIVQEKRRKLQEELFITQKKLQESRDILHKTPMGENQYIIIVTEVHELLKEQKNLQETFAWYDQTEREQQTSLALAINNSQDHERTYREKNKYLSLLTGLMGGLLGLVGSTINNWRYRKNIEVYESHISDQVRSVQRKVDELKSGSSNDAALLQMRELEELVDSVGDGRTELESSEGSNLDLQFECVSQRMERDLNSKLNSYTSVNIGVVGGVVLLGTVLLYMGGVR